MYQYDNTEIIRLILIAMLSIRTVILMGHLIMRPRAGRIASIAVKANYSIHHSVPCLLPNTSNDSTTALVFIHQRFGPFLTFLICRQVAVGQISNQLTTESAVSSPSQVRIARSVTQGCCRPLLRGPRTF
jgi:hypothetical protein